VITAHGDRTTVKTYGRSFRKTLEVKVKIKFPFCVSGLDVELFPE
jgi:hypothetical protein